MPVAIVDATAAFIVGIPVCLHTLEVWDAEVDQRLFNDERYRLVVGG